MDSGSELGFDTMKLKFSENRVGSFFVSDLCSSTGCAEIILVPGRHWMHLSICGPLSPLMSHHQDLGAEWTMDIRYRDTETASAS
jgi:hypothetical protein